MKKSVLNQALSKSLRAKYIAVGGAHRFRSFQAWLLEADLPTDLHAFLAMFAFDGIRIKDFNSTIESHPSLYQPGKVGISWHDNIGRTQRVRLSPMTVFLLEKTNWNSVQNIQIEALEEVYRKFSGHNNALDHFTADQLAWFSEIASGLLIEHFLGRIPMTALANECYVRDKTKLVILTEHIDSSESEEPERISSIALQGFFEPVGHDKNPMIIDRLLQICHRKRIDDKSKQKQSILAECLNLAQEAADYGPTSSLILSWACDLIGHGTSNKTNISVSTIVNYLGVLSRPIFHSIRQEDIASWDSAKFEELYRKLIFEISSGQKKNMASAINSWHQFLTNWLDIPPITKKLHDEVSEVPPQANILWVHEYELIQEWLANAKTDERIILYLQAMFCVAFKIRIRINELLKLKISDINIFDSTVEISIRGTKSKAAKRRVEIESFDVVELIKLIQRRQNESALPDDLLFADPNKIDKVYELSKLYTYSNQLLKAATGDRTIRFHALSHTVISRIISEMLSGGTTALLNPLHQSATDIAHFSILTSANEYVHLYEDAMRETINRGLQDLAITSSTASKWSGVAPETIRKRISRSGIDKNYMYWQIIFDSTDTSRIAAVEDLYKVVEPEKPKFLSEIHKIDYMTILNVFCDIAKHTPLVKISLRQSINVEKIKNLLSHARSVIIKGHMHKALNFDSSINQVVTEISKLRGVDFNKPQKSKLISITKWLNKNHLTDEIMNGAKAWLFLQKFEYISLSSATHSRNLISALFEIGLPVTHLAIAHSEPVDLNNLIIIQSIFYEAYGTTVPQFLVEKRRGRPNTYLLASSARVQSGVMPKPAATSLVGLNALFFILMIVLEGELINEK